MNQPRDCETCGETADRLGFCACHPPAVICCYCDPHHLMQAGSGLVEWEAGIERPKHPVSHGMCAEASGRRTCIALVITSISHLITYERDIERVLRAVCAYYGFALGLKL